MSIKQLIIRFIEEEGPKFGGQIEDHIRSIMGAKASNASRRCRELVESGILERELCKIEGVGNMVVKYRIKPMQKPVEPMQKPENSMHWRPEVEKQRLINASQSTLL